MTIPGTGAMPEPGFALWLTGLPASGKTTLAGELRALLAEKGIHTQILDSDELRTVLTPEPTYSRAERNWFYDVVVYLAQMLTANGVNVLVAATAPRRAYRTNARRRIARFAEVHVDCSLEQCAQRDPHGMYEKAWAGELPTLPGVGSPFEKPLAPEVRVDTGRYDPETAARIIWETLAGRGFWT